MLAVGRRPDPQVDDQVEDGTAGAVDVFRLAGRDVGEVDSPQDPAAGDGVVGLDRGEGPADDLGQLVPAEPLQERAAVVAVRPRAADVGVRDLQRRNVHARHGIGPPVRTDTRRNSAVALTSCCRIVDVHEKGGGPVLSSHRTREVTVR